MMRHLANDCGFGRWADQPRGALWIGLLGIALALSTVWSAQAGEAPAIAPAAAQASQENETSPSDKKPDAPPLQATPPAAPKVCAPQRAAQCLPFRVRQQDQVWAVSTRNLGRGCAANQQPGGSIWRYEARHWKPATTADFYATDSADMVTTFFIHGNRIDHWLALRDGLDVYFQLVGKLDDERPVRFVIWSWPSSQIKGPLKDVRSKAWRSDTDAYYLARFLAGMSPDVPTGIVGYSYGARIAGGALHLLGGGNLNGQTIAAGERPPIRVAFWAAAMHNHWLLPGHYHGQALPMADRWLITYNCCDPVLSRYQWLEKCGNPVALGYSGFYGRNRLSSELNARVEEMNVTRLVGGTHDMRPYLYSLPIQNRTRQYVFWHELEEKKPVEPVAALAAK